MITTIIFDFGDIFINLEKDAQVEAFEKLGLSAPNEELIEKNDLFEKGQISSQDFLESFQKYLPNASLKEIKDAWNKIIGDFPLRRLEFLQLLSYKYKLFLLTNTDEIHIKRFEQNVGISFLVTFINVLKKYIIPMKWGCENLKKQFFPLY